jgi:predicted transcriptional regulator
MRLEKLYETRTAKGWSQYDLSAESGVPQQTISRAEVDFGSTYSMGARVPHEPTRRRHKTRDTEEAVNQDDGAELC